MGLTAQSVSRFFSFRKKKQKDWAFPEELCRRFTLAEISAATQCFDQTLCIGKSAFGTVYKGRIKVDGDEDRKDVAIQRISGGSERRMREFRAEVQLLCQLRHPNLISLIGFCQENGERITVYDYMPNGVKHAVIHRDVKCFNVLLDQNLVPKLSSFGLSKMGPPALSNALIKMNSNLTGTFGYVDPEYLDSGNVTEKSDVYSFGVVLLEVLCAKSILILSNERPGSGAIFPDLIDPFLKGKVAPDCLKKFMNITVRCLRRTGAERPTMGEVQVELECALELQESADAVKQLKELGTSASTSLAPPLPAYDMEDYTYENISFSEINETFCILVRFI
ncbi:receptor-like protein kinase ANXUR2 isoform X4 [Pyrus x bretschneideri]|uniref:receptor-like protein kinase ANXUR2 isoform X4 n=1 Tax=Pyrus x bretschneideri TaxID=225117 RepID=UPI002030E0CF|nr:receptor-like protein kinase ANXUR2 isoform X4 [Pyrus x bretschneideri]